MCSEGRWSLGPRSTTATVDTLSRDVEGLGLEAAGPGNCMIGFIGKGHVPDNHSDQPTLARKLPPRYFSGCSNLNLICSQIS